MSLTLIDRRAKRLWDFYRITPEEHAAILAFEKGHSEFQHLVTGAQTNVDHRHDDGLIRGLLDWRINKGAGVLEKCAPLHMLPTVLRALAAFIENPPAVTVIGERFGVIGKAQYKKKMVYGS